MTIINGIHFPHESFSREKVEKILKEKGKYYRCRICNFKYVQKEGEICEGCRIKVDSEVKL